MTAGPAYASSTTTHPPPTTTSTTATRSGTTTTTTAATKNKAATTTTVAVDETTSPSDPTTTTTAPAAPSTAPTTTEPATTEPVTTTTTEAPTSSTTEPPTTTTTTPVDTTPVAAETAPPIGAGVAPELGAGTADPVASAAQLAYAAFSPWTVAVTARDAAGVAVATIRAEPGVGADEVAAAEVAATTAETKVSSLSLGYRLARDALADAVVVRAGRPAATAVELSAIWEQTDPKRLGVVFTALMQVGDPYVFAAAGPDRFDCSGLTRYAWQTAGVSLVHYAITQREQTLDAAPAALQPGDLVFRFQVAGGHVMLYLGIDDLVVQAGGTATGVVVSPWGRTDAFGSPLAASSTPAALSAPDAMFGATAGARGVAPDLPYAAAFDIAGARYGVAPSLLAAIAAVGTGYRADASTAADGLMQLRPALAAELRVDPTVAVQAVDGAARRLADLWNRLHDVGLVVAAYHSALRTVNDGAAVPHDDATQAYVAAVMAAATPA